MSTGRQCRHEPEEAVPVSTRTAGQWTDSQIFLLLGCLVVVECDVSRPAMWNKVADVMNAVGHHFTAGECQSKWEELRRQVLDVDADELESPRMSALVEELILIQNKDSTLDSHQANEPGQAFPQAQANLASSITSTGPSSLQSSSTGSEQLIPLEPIFDPDDDWFSLTKGCISKPHLYPSSGTHTSDREVAEPQPRSSIGHDIFRGRDSPEASAGVEENSPHHGESQDLGGATSLSHISSIPSSFEESSSTHMDVSSSTATCSLGCRAADPSQSSVLDASPEKRSSLSSEDPNDSENSRPCTKPQEANNDSERV